jgi:hypothetical protein
MITTQTIEINRSVKDELEVLATALDLMAKKNYTEAARVLIERKDVLMKDAPLKIYDQREA